VRPTIFVCYRRQDSKFWALKIHAALADVFGPRNVFVDTRGLVEGQNYDTGLRTQLAKSTVLIVVIGRRWTSILAERMTAADSNEIDYVQEEISTGLRARMHVIPLFVEGEHANFKDLLPHRLAGLGKLQHSKVTYTNFDEEISKLAFVIRSQHQENLWKGINAGVAGLIAFALAAFLALSLGIAAIPKIVIP